MAHSVRTHSPSPVMTTNNKPLSPAGVSPTPSNSSNTVAPSGKDLDRPEDNLNHRRVHSNSDHQQQPPSPPYPRRSPGSGHSAHNSYSEPNLRLDEQRPPYYAPTPGQEQAPWPQQRGRDARDTRDDIDVRDNKDVRDGDYMGPRERYPALSPYNHHDPSYYNGGSSIWPRPQSPPPSQGAYKHLSFTRHGAGLRARSPPPPQQPYSSRPPHSDPSPQRSYPMPPHQAMPPSPLEPTPRSHRSPESYQAKRHRLESDSDGYSDQEGRHRQAQGHDLKSPRDRDHNRELYHPSSYHGYGDSSRDYHTMSAYPGSTNLEGLPALAPRPPRYVMEDDLGPGSDYHGGPYHHHQSQHHMQQHSSQNQTKKENAEPFKIQSARGTPKGPLPIDVQISLLSSVLKHDPFNCAIRKTTQAWELISREQGIRARTCSRRFDNIIQASIAGRDRPVGTEEQQATKKKLLEQLFEMMNQPQALKRMQKKRRYRSEDTDRRLLMETIRLNPFAQRVGQVAKAWEDVRDALNMKVHARQCIRRVNRMVKPYQLRERMYKGNIPDEMKEANDDLVKQVIQLMRVAGQGGSLDDACNSNDDDSASCMSDSEDQEDGYMDSKRQDNAQEDDELEEDEDEEMQPRSESEYRTAHKHQENDVKRSVTSPISPSAPTATSPSTLPTTPSLSASASGPSSTSAPATPAKRGRPRNPVSTSQSNRPSSHSSTDRARGNALGDNTKGAQVPHRGWDGEASESKGSLSLSNVSPEDKVAMQSAQLSSPLSLYPSSAQGHARHYSQSDYAESGDYRRPIKHARTNSRGIHDGADMGRPDRARPMSPSGGRQGPAHAYHGREKEEAGYRYGFHGSRGPAVDSHGRPIQPSPHESDLMGPSTPTGQQYREVMSELHIMREYLAQMDEHRRVEMEQQGSMMYMIEKLQHQIQQQQQQLSQLQHQVRYGYTGTQLPLSHSPHHSHQQQQHPQGAQGSAPASGGPPSGGRYPSHTSEHPGSVPKAVEGHSVDRQGPEGVHHYSRSDPHFAPRDRDLR
ncbi:hypothetical protein BGZ54_009429 [Gamsiella multidivaricata]|nr:hypothetical protein BGZ54_009429 [Gamsiella multidivaricata]